MAQAKQMKPEKTRKSNFKFTRDLIDGLAKQNVVLMTGIVNAPVIIAATTFKKGVVIALAFAIISFLTIVTCSFVPKKIVYTLRVIIYALVGSVYYIPTVLLLEQIFPLTVELIGIYMPLIITNALIFSKTESRFYLEDKLKTALHRHHARQGFEQGGFAAAIRPDDRGDFAARNLHTLRRDDSGMLIAHGNIYAGQNGIHRLFHSVPPL